jgi:hypothetical protein
MHRGPVGVDASLRPSGSWIRPPYLMRRLLDCSIFVDTEGSVVWYQHFSDAVADMLVDRCGFESLYIRQLSLQVTLMFDAAKKHSVIRVAPN